MKEHYYDTFLQNLKEGIEWKLKEDIRDNNIDEYHYTLQAKDNWYTLLPIHITQRDGWSDNFKEVRNFSEIIKNIPR